VKQENIDWDLSRGLIRLHILHHAAKKPVFGLWFIEELARHGYKLSPGTSTLYFMGLRVRVIFAQPNNVKGKVPGNYYSIVPRR